MKTTAPASCGPMREMALLMEDARPALATGTDAISAAVKGATMIPNPSPKTIVAGRKSTRYDTGGNTLDAECGFRVHGEDVAGTRAYKRHATAITNGPTMRKGRAPYVPVRVPNRGDMRVSSRPPGTNMSPAATAV